MHRAWLKAPYARRGLLSSVDVFMIRRRNEAGPVTLQTKSLDMANERLAAVERQHHREVARCVRRFHRRKLAYASRHSLRVEGKPGRKRPLREPLAEIVEVG